MSTLDMGLATWTIAVKYPVAEPLVSGIEFYRTITARNNVPS
jgi:hypothetical protein